MHIGPTVSVTLDELEAVDPTFYLSLTPFIAQGSLNSPAISLQASREMVELHNNAFLGTVQPLVKPLSRPFANQLPEILGRGVCFSSSLKFTGTRGVLRIF